MTSTKTIKYPRLKNQKGSDCKANKENNDLNTPICRNRSHASV